jgi:hypothetical protein
MQCRRTATRTVARAPYRTHGDMVREYPVCGVHGKLHDEGRDVFISQSRRS